jgi:hypothetical protein
LESLSEELKEHSRNKTVPNKSPKPNADVFVAKASSSDKENSFKRGRSPGTRGRGRSPTPEVDPAKQTDSSKRGRFDYSPGDFPSVFFPPVKAKNKKTRRRSIRETSPKTKRRSIINDRLPLRLRLLLSPALLILPQFFASPQQAREKRVKVV